MQLALAAAGSAIGGQLLGTGIVALGMTGNAIGWAVGSLVGGMLGQKASHTRQPGIGDKSVQASTYGSFQTLIYGAMRVAGNVIDGVPEIREVATTTRVGKGGPKGSNTTLTWNCDIAIDLCQAGVAGIRKMWLGGKLVYDVSTGGTASSILATSARAKAFKLYDGSESQLPDPTLEAIHGVGNVPAYRGRSYVVFTELDCPNGQIPQLHFEVCMAVTPGGTLPALTPPLRFQPLASTQPFNYTSISRVCGPDAVYHMCQNFSASYAWVAEGFKAGIGYSQPLFAGDRAFRGSGVYTSMPGMTGSHKRPLAVRSTLASNGVYSSIDTVNVIDMITGAETVVHEFVPGTIDYLLIPHCAAWDEITERFVVLGKATSGVNYERFNPGIYTIGGGLDVRIALPSTSGVPLAFYNGIVYALDQRSGVTYLQSYSGTTGAFISEVAGGPGTIDLEYSLSVGADPISSVAVEGCETGICAHAGGVFVYAKNLNSIWRVDNEWKLLSSTVAASSGAHGFLGAWIDEDHIVAGPLVASPDSAMHYRIAATRAFDPVDVTVSDIVEDICTRAGLASGEVDASDLTDTLRGYAITSQSSGRAALEPLLKCFFVDAREQDGQVQFILRADQVSSFTVTFDELAAHDAADVPDALPLARSDESTLPRSVSVSYIDPEADYQAGSQVAIRQTALTINEQSDELPLAISPAQAASVAEVLLFDAWSQRNARSVSLSRKFAAVSPGDVGTFEYPQGVTTLKRVTRARDTGTLVSMELVDGDAPLYVQSAQGAALPAEQAAPEFSGPTRLELLDIPILRDADDNPGLYVAIAGQATPWSGAALYKGNDDATLEPIGSVSVGTSIGYATTVLGNWTQNTLDSINSVTVENAGTLSSVTYDAALNNGENLCLIGDELLQFLTATYVSAGKYVLTNLLRGRRGTEDYRSQHALLDRFVAVPATGVGILRAELNISEIGQTRQYRAITFGKALDTQQSTSFASTGAALKPFAPVNLRRRSFNGDTTLTWDRRTRLSGEFMDGVDVPLGESVEAYVVEIYASSAFATVVRTINTATAQAEYTLAQQSADFGVYQTTLYLRIYQVSSSVGRGFPLQATSTQANASGPVTSLLAHFDGAGILTTPVDSGPYGFVATLVGAELSSAQSKFGGSSLRSPTAGDKCLFATSAAAFDFGTGNWTVEFWFYSAVASNAAVFGISDTGSPTASQTAMSMRLNTSTKTVEVYLYSGAAATYSGVSASGLYTTSSWNHVAVCLSAGVVRTYLNGVEILSAAHVADINYADTFAVHVGGWPGAGNGIAGIHIEELRIIKDALYTAPFTPPTAPY
jgi:hypothetical protein